MNKCPKKQTFWSNFRWHFFLNFASFLSRTSLEFGPICWFAHMSCRQNILRCKFCRKSALYCSLLWTPYQTGSLRPQTGSQRPQKGFRGLKQAHGDLQHALQGLKQAFRGFWCLKRAVRRFYRPLKPKTGFKRLQTDLQKCRRGEKLPSEFMVHPPLSGIQSVL